MKKSETGISLYPDFYDSETLKIQIEKAAHLGYTHCFTSIQLGNLGFEKTKENATDDFRYLFDLCDQHKIIVHVDINDKVLKQLGGSPSELSVIHTMKIKVLRLDGGFSDEEVALMTNNPYGIEIEDNTSMVHEPDKRIQTIKKLGTLTHYVACHNFFPRNDTGLSFDDTVNLAKRYADQGIKNGVFIASLASPHDLNASGQGVPTVEEHRFVPPHISFSELRNTGLFDVILFGDSLPSDDELKAVSRLAALDYVEIPIWLDQALPDRLKHAVTDTVLKSRIDQPENVVRMTQTRQCMTIPPHHAINRPAYAITIDNTLSNRYEGELQIMLKDCPPSPIANVIGQVKPYGKRLVHQIKANSLPFKLTEE